MEGYETRASYDPRDGRLGLGGTAPHAGTMSAASGPEAPSLSIALELQNKLIQEVFGEVRELEQTLTPLLATPTPAGGNGTGAKDSPQLVDWVMRHNEGLRYLATYVRTVRERLQL